MLTFAGPDTLRPCVIKFWVTPISALLEPRTASTATTSLAGLLASAALGTRATHCRCDSRS